MIFYIYGPMLLMAALGYWAGRAVPTGRLLIGLLVGGVIFCTPSLYSVVFPVQFGLPPPAVAEGSLEELMTCWRTWVALPGPLFFLPFFIGAIIGIFASKIGKWYATRQH